MAFKFRKALAFSLAAAMVITATPAAGLDVQAAGKVKATTIKLSASKASLVAGKTKKITVTLNKKSTKNVKVTLKSSKASVAKVAKSVTVKKNAKTAKFTITAKKAGSAKITASFKNAKGVTKTANIKVTVSAKNEDDVVVNEGKITITDVSGLQSDGTALVKDTLQVNIPAELGTMSDIIWYRDNNALVTSTTNTTSNRITGNGTANTSVPGKYYAVAVSTKGTTYKSDPITVTDKEVPAVIKSVSIEDDYVKPNISYSEQDEKGVVKVVMNKAYKGVFKLYKATDTKLTTQIAGTIKTADSDSQANTTAVVKDSEPKVTDFGSVVGSAAKYYINPDNGVYTIAFNLVTNATKVQRGTSYIVVFDQDGIDSDDISKGSENKSTAVTCPYVKAPAKMAITSVAKGAKPEITFYDESGAVMKWFGQNNAGVAQNAKDLQFTDLSFYAVDAAKTTGGNEETQDINSSKIKDGVLTGNNVIASNDKFFYAKASIRKGTYGDSEINLSTEAASTAQKAAAGITLYQKKDAATTAVVKFSDLLCPGTVYVVQPDNTSDRKTLADALDKFDKDDASTYVGKATAKKGDGTVDVAGAISRVSAVGVENLYGAIFIPDNEADYAKVMTVSATPYAENDSDKDAVLNYSLQISHKASTFTLDEIKNVATNSRFEVGVRDQFGEKMTMSIGDISSTMAMADESAAPFNKNNNVTNNNTITVNNVGSSNVLQVSYAQGGAEVADAGYYLRLVGTDYYLKATVNTAGNPATYNFVIEKLDKAPTFDGTAGGTANAAASYIASMVLTNAALMSTVKTGTAVAGTPITMGAYAFKDQYGANYVSATSSAAVTCSAVSIGTLTDKTKISIADITDATMLGTDFAFTINTMEDWVFDGDDTITFDVDVNGQSDANPIFVITLKCSDYNTPVWTLQSCTTK